MGDTRQYSELPQNVFEYLGDFDAIPFVIELLRKYAVGDQSKHTSEVLAIVSKVALGQKSLNDIPGELTVLLNTSQAQGTRAAIDLVANRILPFGAILNIDVDSALRSWGADPAQFASIPRIGAEPTALSQPESPSSHKVFSETGAIFSDPIMQHRLELILASYRDGVRTKEQAMGVLKRPVKTGGLEMNEGEAERVLGLVDVTKHELATDSTNGPRKATNKDVGSELSDVSTEPLVGAKADHFSDSDAVEVAAIAETKKAALEVPTLITDTKAAADRIVAEAKLTFPSGEIRTRFDHIIDARLRDVRDGFGTREKLEASVESGGVGMSGAALVAAMEMVESMDAMHHLALGAKTDFLKEKIATEKAERVEKAEGQKVQDAQIMSQRYAEITGKAPDAHVEPVSAARTSIAVPASAATEQRAQSIDTSKVKAAIEAAKTGGPTVTPVMSAATIPATVTGRPVVEDIRFERKLAGPIEELRMLTLSDFRRLSSDPRQATLRIRDKVELAAHEGYEHRIAAIKAWRQSPLSQLYVAVSREALMAGKSIVDVLAEKRSRGEDALRDDELHAVVELNGILRF